MKTLTTCMAVALCWCTWIEAAEPDILIADFEGKDYGRWKVTGEAFGPGPARGTLPHQMKVTGFEGKGLVNTFYKCDGTTGTLVSPDFRITHNYLSFQIGGPAGTRAQVQLLMDNKVVRSQSGAAAKEPTWITWDVSELKGRTAQLKITEMPSPDGTLLIRDSLTHSNRVKGILIDTGGLYQETYRPQFHFTSRKNWINDPNGLVYYKGVYHLFFQHNPKGINHGNMTWGHAVSPDMVRWKQLEHAIYPDKLGTIYSGSAVVDWYNTAGFQTGREKAIVCIYTSAGKPFTQSIAYSNDGGRTFTTHRNNPVMGHIVGSNRDPKVLWHEPTKKWVMALYLDKNDYALFASPNLKQWTRLSDVPMPGSTECPDFFELPVDGNTKNTRWVFWGGNNNYLLGTFDGKTFTKESGPHRSNWGGHCYAAQTWSDIPPSDGRRLQIAWMRAPSDQYPGMPFNQQMSFPTELTLRTTPAGVRLYKKPVREIENLHAKKHSWADRALAPGGENLLSGIEGELFDIRAEIEVGKATEVGFTLRGQKVAYDVAGRKVTALGKTAPLAPIDGRIRLQILLDRSSIEVFGNDGLISMPTCFLPDLLDKSLGIYAVGGQARIVSLEVHELRSAWR